MMNKDSQTYSLDDKANGISILMYWVSTKLVKEQDLNMRDVYEAIYDELREIWERGHYSNDEKDYLNSLRSLYLDRGNNVHESNNVNHNN